LRTAGEIEPADGTNWHEGKLRQEGSAESARGREGDATQGIQRTSEHAGHCAPPGSFRWWNVERQRTGVPEEDAPHFGAVFWKHGLAASIPGRGRGCHERR
jgi:hypothetical protein